MIIVKTADWSVAPPKAEFYAGSGFCKVKDGIVEYFKVGWIPTDFAVEEVTGFVDYQPRPKEWPASDERISAIAQNGGDGLHYTQQEATKGKKYDQGKPMYNLLPPIAINAMAEVLTHGANKYAPNNWRKVESAQERYQAALLRHAFAYLSGEVNDKESGLPHMAHVMCCAAFLVELEK